MALSQATSALSHRFRALQIIRGCVRTSPFVFSCRIARISGYVLWQQTPSNRHRGGLIRRRHLLR